MNIPPDLDLDPYDRAAVVDPYAYHDALREAPVVRLSRYGVYATGCHEEAAVVMTDHDRFSTTAGIGIGDARLPGPHARPRNPLLEVDPPDHTALRHVVNRIISPATVRHWREDMSAAAKALVDSLAADQEVEATEDLVERFIHQVFVRAVGIRFDREAIRAIGNLNGNQTGPQNSMFDDAMHAAAPYAAWFEQSQQREHVLPGGIAEQFFGYEDAGEIAPGTASTLTRTFVRGGMDSTIAGLGSTLMHLASDPVHWAFLRATPGKVRAAFDEGVRLETPFQMSYRITRGATRLGGLDLAPDTKIGVFMGAANRDPRRWTEPERYDPARNLQGHLAFGVGAHNCIGQMLAKLEAECLLGALLARFARVEAVAPPKWKPMNQVRTLDSLRLRFSER
jgi:cytochrome P450